MKGRVRFILFVSIAHLFLAGAAVARAEQLRDASVLSTLDASHPRLMLKDEALGRLKASYDEDEALEKCWRDVHKDAEACLKKKPLEYKKVGRGLGTNRTSLKEPVILVSHIEPSILYGIVKPSRYHWEQSSNNIALYYSVKQIM